MFDIQQKSNAAQNDPKVTVCHANIVENLYFNLCFILLKMYTSLVS